MTLPLSSYPGTAFAKLTAFNRPRSIYQYSNMAPRLSSQTSIFGVVFFVSKSLLELEDKRNLQFSSESVGTMLEY